MRINTRWDPKEWKYERFGIPIRIGRMASGSHPKRIQYNIRVGDKKDTALTLRQAKKRAIGMAQKCLAQPS